MDNQPRMDIFVNSAQYLRFLAPTNSGTDTWVTGGSGWVSLLEEGADQNLAASALISAVDIFVADASEYEAGDNIVVWTDTGALHETTVSGAPDLTVTPNKITLAVGLVAAAVKSRQVSKRLGPKLAIAEYVEDGHVKTPYLQNGKAGYRASKAFGHAGLVVGTPLRVYYQFVGAGGDELERSRRAIVVE